MLPSLPLSGYLRGAPTLPGLHVGDALELEQHAYHPAQRVEDTTPMAEQADGGSSMPVRLQCPHVAFISRQGASSAFSSCLYPILRLLPLHRQLSSSPEQFCTRRHKERACCGFINGKVRLKTVPAQPLPKCLWETAPCYGKQTTKK
jgi:hypothetical protein